VTPVPQSISDRELMRRVQQDDPDAFGTLYDRLAAPATRIAQLTIQGDADADRVADAVQEGFLSIWRGRDQYRPDLGEVHTWVFGIVRNRAIDSMRRNGRHDRHRGDADELERVHPAAHDTEGDFLTGDDARSLRVLIVDLPAEQRDVIALAYYGGCTHTEIADRLDLPLGTVKGRMRLGMEKLRGRMNA
jgi:RNA polymerase sigma-70 factor, ECF subfamily